MIKNNNKIRFCGRVKPIRNKAATLLLSSLMVFWVTSSTAQDDSQEGRWSVNSNNNDEQVAATVNASDKIAATVSANDIARLESQLPVTDDVFNGYDVTIGAEPLNPILIDVTPTISVSPELRESLERQFEEIQAIKETEDAFSERLGESFLAYGRTLMKVGRIDESRKMLVNALHITKINNGVNSIDQRPILRELFELNFALGNVVEAEDQVRRIIWLEKKPPVTVDNYSFDLVVRLGNLYLDFYLNRPFVSELSIEHLDKATQYLGYAVNRYGDRPLSEVLLPYGELALAHYYKGLLQTEVDRSFLQGPRERGLREFEKANRRETRRINSFARSESYLRNYLRKAKSERDLVNTIRALLGLGDLNLLAEKTRAANSFYELAWTGAQSLPITHPLVESFNDPVKLPSFQFSVVRKAMPLNDQSRLIPMSVNIGVEGYVDKVARNALIETTKSITGRARRLVKRLRFRPIIENGRLIPIDDYRYEVLLPLRKSDVVATKTTTNN